VNGRFIDMNKTKIVTAIYDFAAILASSVITVAFIFAFLFKVSTVNGDSMVRTLNNGDRLIITARDYNIEQGDIVIISQPNAYEKVLIKRVIAKGGQTVDIDTVNGVVIVDGEVLDEPYLSVKTKTAGDGFTYPVTVPEGKLFVMGDNRNISADSRYAGVGFIDERYVVGEAIYRIGDKGLRIQLSKMFSGFRGIWLKREGSLKKAFLLSMP